MKKILLIIFLSILTSISSQSIVNIWSDNQPENFGVSMDRVWLKSYFLSNFDYYNTLETSSTAGVLTAVTVSRELYFLLEDLLKNDNNYMNGNVELSINNGIYHYVDNIYFLDFSFSLEKPNQEIIDLINKVYINDSYTKQIVVDHYLESWVIRVYSAENVISPDINTLDFDDILITATIIGESFQWLWGIHDGVDLLTKTLSK